MNYEPLKAFMTIFLPLTLSVALSLNSHLTNLSTHIVAIMSQNTREDCMQTRQESKRMGTKSAQRAPGHQKGQNTRPKDHPNNKEDRKDRCARTPKRLHVKPTGRLETRKQAKGYEVSLLSLPSLAILNGGTKYHL